ncbi:hypothetical protein AURDEDRAFT_55402 [Auricularia subglabra TFB-10046 SS5]|nr:hypothetical protein AURDEDRAFT_55402 [Auricularia subglabra TFB-10046 SS5]
MRDNTVVSELFRETLAAHILAKAGAQAADGDELDDFTSYLASEAWTALPASVRDASYEHPSPPFELHDAPVAFSDSLVAYGVVPDAEDALRLLRAAVDAFVEQASSPPAIGKQTRAGVDGCEVCTRDMPLTYHHLIPRSVHSKVLKRGWHPAERLNAVAWLCRSCHSTVHRVASNEDLARNFYTVDLLIEREDIQRWRAWASRQRYGKRLG